MPAPASSNDFKSPIWPGPVSVAPAPSIVTWLARTISRADSSAAFARVKSFVTTISRSGASAAGIDAARKKPPSKGSETAALKLIGGFITRLTRRAAGASSVDVGVGLGRDGEYGSLVPASDPFLQQPKQDSLLICLVIAVSVLD